MTKYAGCDVLEAMVHAKNYNNFLADFALKHCSCQINNIIDFGAGMGTFSEILRSKGHNVKCVEIDEDLQAILKNKGFEVLETLDEIEDNSCECIVSFNVLEHIENDVEAINKIQQKLKPNGHLFIYLPAFNCLYSSFDKALGHYRRYNAEQLALLCISCGLEVKRFEYADSLGFLAAYVYKIINKQGSITPLNIKIFDTIIFPLSRLIDRLFANKLFGKNVALYATRTHLS